MATIKGLRKEFESATRHCENFEHKFMDLCERAARKCYGEVHIKPVDADGCDYCHIANIDTIIQSDPYGVLFADSNVEGVVYGYGQLHITTMMAIAEEVAKIL